MFSIAARSQFTPWKVSFDNVGTVYNVRFEIKDNVENYYK